MRRKARTIHRLTHTATIAFGSTTAMSADGYLALHGVTMSSTVGLVMHRPGSVIGFSVQVNLTSTVSGDVTFQVHKGGVAFSALNLEFLSSLGTGVANASIVASAAQHVFAAGDILAVYADETGDMAWNNVLGLLEVQYD